MKPTLRQLLIACDHFTINASEDTQTWEEDGDEVSFNLDKPNGTGGEVKVLLEQKCTLVNGHTLVKTNDIETGVMMPMMFAFYKTMVRPMNARDLSGAFLAAEVASEIAAEEPSEG